MRPLEDFIGHELIWIGTIGNFGTRKKNNSETVLLIDLKPKDFDIKIDHCWMAATDYFNSTIYKKGQIIQFRATIREYKKNSGNDLGLYKPNQIKVIGRNKKLDPISTLEPSKRINLRDIMDPKKSNIP